MGGGPPEFPQGSTCLVVLRIPLAPLKFRLRGFHPLWPAFPMPFSYPPGHLLRSITPECTHPGLGSFHFARRYFGNRCFFLFLRLLRCFSSPGSLHMTIYSSYGDSALPLPGFPIRISAVLRSLAAPRSFSQLTTSFFGCWCLGIRPMLFSCLIYCFSSACYCLSIVLC